MDTGVLIAVVIVALVIFGAILRIARPATRRGETPDTPDLVTQNLDYSILGQRPEIITEDDEPEADSSS